MHAVAFRASPQEKDRFLNKLRNADKYDDDDDGGGLAGDATPYHRLNVGTSCNGTEF